MPSIADLLNQDCPAMRDPRARRSQAPSQSSRNFSPANRNLSENERLTRVVRDASFFETALTLTEYHFGQRTDQIDSPSIRYVEAGLRRGVLEHDFQANFHLAVGTPVLNILETLSSGTFSCQSGDGDADVTDDLWLADEVTLVSGEHKTKQVKPILVI